MCAIEKMEDLVRLYSSRRDDQGNAKSFAEDIRKSSLEALLPDDLEKRVQLNRARVTSCGGLREEIKTYCECRGHANALITPRRRRPDGHWCIWQRQRHTRQRQARQGQRQKEAAKDSMDRTRTKTRTRARIRLSVGIVENADTTRKIVGARRTKVVRRENTNPRMQMLTILTRNHQLLNLKSKSMNST